MTEQCDKPDLRHRNKLWQPHDLQESISNASVVIGGMGGLGWQIGSALIGLGVKNLTIFDPDVLETTNLNRLWGCKKSDIGRKKAAIFRDLATHIHDDLNISAYYERIPSIQFESSLSKATVVFGGYDDAAPRVATQVLSLKYNTLYIDSGIALQSKEDSFIGSGQVFTSIPGHMLGISGCIVCAGLRQGGIGYRGEGNGPEPSSSIPNAILANFAVSTWIQYLQHAPISELRVFDWNLIETHAYEQVDSNDSCPICGEHPSWQDIPDLNNAES